MTLPAFAGEAAGGEGQVFARGLALTKEQKQARLEALQHELQGASTLVLVGFSGLTVEQDFELRKQLWRAAATGW